MLPESIAIVCAPSKDPDWGVFRLTDPPGLKVVSNCTQTGLFHPHTVSNLYTDGLRPGHVFEAQGLEFETVDLRPEQKVSNSPACPGIVKVRPLSPRSRIPPGSDVFEVFANVRADKDLSDEEAFLKLLTTYDVPLSSLSRIYAGKLEASFSNITYQQVAPYVWLSPSAAGRDMQPLDVFRARIPKDMFREITRDVEDALTQYGPLDSHDNEETRSRFISSSTIVNKPEGLLGGEFTNKGRIKHHFIAVDSVSTVFMEVKEILTVSKSGLDIKGQVLAECAACEYANLKGGHWVPILAILCDGDNFEFFVYDSVDRLIYSSGRIPGIIFKERGDKLDLLISMKRTTEYLFDWFVMAYVNGIRSLGYRSRVRSGLSSEKWTAAIASAEKAHCLLREAAQTARDGKFDEAERMASDGVDPLKLSVSELPYQQPYERELESLWDGSKCLEEAFNDPNIFH
ncbi:hypothetical protein Egran_06231 [Elaphomyces granulatus]|uniref:Uncharacterized protein n=1 Tax=Elaphomyces granulatus TaxID=519963 RepID=A0A232LPB2_9EURO|nr:hypothetical protein Egran_06231 [Elaphomyces granulatus]